MILALIGSRDYNDYAAFAAEVRRLIEEHGWDVTEIVSGDAKGADRLAWQFALMNKLKLKEFPADWNKFGKRAGHMRNTDIVNYADVVIAFWDLVSSGTRDSIDKTNMLGKPLIIVNINTLGKTS